jgi:predicted TIM-barrel fold metal-dependent hydrolase
MEPTRFWRTASPRTCAANTYSMKSRTGAARLAWPLVRAYRARARAGSVGSGLARGLCTLRLVYAGPLIDCDVHHEWPSQADLLPYLSENWREYVLGTTHAGGAQLPYSPSQIWLNPVAGWRGDAYPPAGGPPGSDYDWLAERLLEPNQVARAILQYESVGSVGALANPYFAAEVARAANDWSIDRWLSRDDPRLYGALLVATQEPETAAAEIRRIGWHPRMAEVLLVASGLGKPFGHPAYHPIYEAATEMGLPVAIHAYGEVMPGTNVSPHGGGMPSYYFEVQTLAHQGMETHLVSLIANGVFEKFPALKLLLVESGTSWVPGVLWRMDAAYRATRRELPWLKRLPSEYFYEHVRITTQPLEESPESEQLVELLSAYGGEEVLCFSSDYPHWDADERAHVARLLPQAWLPKVFYENARALYGWSDLPAVTELEVSA